ncbi:transmembrane protein 180-like [Mytilus edulis]|uniref:Uncharacterized protein n=1 Tax=Mytilus edulis TaxID=6550 RepID=A0A8S3TBP1_MYTED|nr:unnamed protein product [Mytilus edulis]
MVLRKQEILAYCAAGVAFHMIASAFNFYYVKVFINHYHIEETWFQIAQTFHMIWTSVSNPLFAYIQDGSKLKISRTRRESILYCGPLFAFSFIVPWFPWGDSSWLVGLHLIITFFLWDTMFTFIGLAVSSLFTEISRDTEDRIKLTRYAQMASILGGPSVMLLEFTSDSLHNFKAFQITSVCVAVCACSLFYYSGLNAHTEYDVKKLEKYELSKNSRVNGKKEPYTNQVCQLFYDRNFIAFIVSNFCHAFHKTFLNSFIAIVCDQLISEDDVPLSVRKLFYGGISLMSTLVIILVTTFVSRYSYYYVIRSAFVYIVFAGVVMLHIGQDHPWCLMVFLLADNCASGATFSLFNMPLADIADDNKSKYNRKQPISSTVFGISALLSKPALSLSPMVTVSILNHYGYSELKNNTVEASHELKHAMFLLICLYPIAIGIVQLIAWSFFDIKQKTVQINVL